MTTHVPDAPESVRHWSGQDPSDAGYCEVCGHHLDSGLCDCTDEEREAGPQGCTCPIGTEYCTC